jgi:hypothetical protein
MKKFVIRMIVILLSTLAIMTVLDVIYTTAYTENKAPRTKFQYLRAFRNASLDYIFIGSSRVDYFVAPDVIEKKTGKKGINAGFSASKMVDVFTVLKLCREYNIAVDETWMQIDHIYNITDYNSPTLEWQMMPYIREGGTARDYYKSHADYNALYYIPFYRYCAYDQAIGFREFMQNLLSRESKAVTGQRGFTPRFGQNIDNEFRLPTRILRRNVTFDSITAFCRENHVKAVYFCAPFGKESKASGYVESLARKVPGLRDYSKAVTDPTMFEDNVHVNEKGALFFTGLLAADMLRQQP